MKLLLDTHTFIWWDSAPAKLSATALALCSDPANLLNAHPDRLDLKDAHVQLARELGCTVVISTNSHRTSELDLMRDRVGAGLQRCLRTPLIPRGHHPQNLRLHVLLAPEPTQSTPAPQEVSDPFFPSSLA